MIMAKKTCTKQLSGSFQQVTISRTAALRRTKKMLVKEWELDAEPLSDRCLGASNNGLCKTPEQVRALETPIEICYFRDVNATVAGHDLAAAKTVGKLRDVIWNGLPENHKQETKQ